MALQQTATDALAAAAEAFAFEDGAYAWRLRCERSLTSVEEVRSQADRRIGFLIAVAQGAKNVSTGTACSSCPTSIFHMAETAIIITSYAPLPLVLVSSRLVLVSSHGAAPSPRVM
jgi:hypothetical protein